MNQWTLTMTLSSVHHCRRRTAHESCRTASNMENNHTFLYFAYGSNLLKERLQLKNPSAIVHCVARLKDYKLVFGNHKGLASDRWHGGVATIEHSPGDEVWGVVWKMNISDLESLDDQENVMLGAYSPVELSVKTKGQEINCRTYIMNSCVYAPPSPQYLQVSQHLVASFNLPLCYFMAGSSKKTAHNVSVGGYGGTPVSPHVSGVCVCVCMCVCVCVCVRP
uniref:Gamma-glutamylcyclotransferase b n=1 Tax=Takifugu rubripes TaxID=31033 RepID=A0A674MGV2_TAKRU